MNFINRNKVGLRWLPAIFFATAIFIFSSMPGDEIEQSVDNLAISLQIIPTTQPTLPTSSYIEIITSTPTKPTLQASPPANIVQTPLPTLSADQNQKKHLPTVPPFLSRFHISWLKIGHMIGYFWLGLSVMYAINNQSRSSPLIAFLLCLLYSVSDELHQLYVPGRTSSIRDILIDTLAASVGAAILLGIMHLGSFLNSKRDPAD